MGTVDCNGVNINYRCMGKGENVVLIHGLAANQGFWHIDVLLSLARKYRVTVFDLRGHGYSSMPSSGYTTASIAGDVHCLMGHLKISRAHLIGHSYGGAIALHYATLYPEGVASLIVADARVRSLQPTNRIEEWPNWRAVKKRLEAHGLVIPEEETEAGLWLLENLARPQWQPIRKQLEGSPLFFPFSRWSGGTRTAQRWRKLLSTTSARQDFIASDSLTPSQLATIRTPTLALCGENSPTIPSLLALGKYIPKCEMGIIPGAGHFFPFTDPKPFSRKACRFFEMIKEEDRRRHKRFPLRLNLDLRVDSGAWFQTQTVDVSKVGLFVQAPPALKIGTKVEIVTVVHQTHQNIALQGKVVRMADNQVTNDFGFGISLFQEGDGNRDWDNFLAA